MSAHRRVDVIFGRSSGWPTTDQSLDTGNTWIDGKNGVELDNSGTTAYCGLYSADLNGDGINDLIVQAPGASPGGKTGAGSVYVYFGKKKAWPATVNLPGL